MTKHITILLLITALFWSCNGDEENPECQASDPDVMLMDIRDFTILPAYQNAYNKIVEARDISQDFILTPSQDQLDPFRNAIKNAWLAWQEASGFEFGPASDVALRSNVNTFPVDSFGVLLRIENQDITLIANDLKGFPALDLLINGIGSTDEEILAIYTGDSAADYTAYLTAVLIDIEDRILSVKATWEDSYGETFPTNTGFSTGSSFSMYINAYIQDWEQIKRERIALPLGLLTFQTPLPNQVECIYGGYSQELALAHAVSHYNIYKSADHLGIQELVEGVTNFTGNNGETLDETMVAQFELGIANLSVVPDPLSETVLLDFDIVNEAYLALQDMVVLMKIDMTSGLGISINFADNDGD